MVHGIRFLLFMSLAALTPVVATATSMVIVSDEALVDQADLIVRATVLSASPAPHGPRTDFVLSPERLLKGESQADPIVRVIGGQDEAGRELRVWGAPRFVPGDEVLLFLTRAEDGSYRLAHFTMGVFHLTGSADRGLAVRDLSEVAVVAIDGVGLTGGERVRDRSSFERWIAERAQGTESPADYFRVPSPFTSITGSFTLFRDFNSGRSIRWFEFDSGAAISWRIRPASFTTGSSPGMTELQNAIAVWNQVPEARINYVAAGTTEATGGLSDFDGVNAVIFNDPNDEVDGTFSCTLGGVLAKGGPWYTPQVFLFSNRLVHRAAGADVVFNNGVSCLATETAALKNFEEVLAHELGHTLGIGHACGDTTSGNCVPETLQNSALMRAFAHFDGRGAVLNSDDRAAAAALYPAPPEPSTQPRRRATSRP